jgi:hypothetical protein
MSSCPPGFKASRKPYRRKPAKLKQIGGIEKDYVTLIAPHIEVSICPNSDDDRRVFIERRETAALKR